MYKGLRIARIAVALTVALVIACAVLNVFGMGDTLGLWLTNMQIIPALITASVGWLIVWAVMTLLFGRAYCSFVCPLGTSMDVLSRTARWLTPRSRRRPYRYMCGVTWLRFLSVVALVEAGSLGFTLMVSIIDPAAAFNRMVKMFVAMSATGLLSGIAVFVVLAIVAAANKGRLLCNTLCPVGAILGATTRVSLMRFDINPDMCIHCGKCEDVCKSRCIKQMVSVVDNTRCVTCFDCVAVCPTGAIKWRVGQHRLQWPLLQRISSAKAGASASFTSQTETTIKNNERISESTAKNT